VLDWDTVALLDRRANAGDPECWIKNTVALLDGRETAG
jgi:hypothetical protein